jgi:hypothetical protein
MPGRGLHQFLRIRPQGPALPAARQWPYAAAYLQGLLTTPSAHTHTATVHHDQGSNRLAFVVIGATAASKSWPGGAVALPYLNGPPVAGPNAVKRLSSARPR